MTGRGRRRFFPVLLALATAAAGAAAETIAIGTSGGDANDVVDEWRLDNVRKFCRKVKEAGADECHRAYSKARLEEKVREAVGKLECGDNLVLFFNGHGARSKGFVFDREAHGSKDRFLKPEELREWLEELAPCAKIYVAWHACYSGRFIAAIADDPRVAVAVSSAGRDQKAHKKPRRSELLGGYVNWRNWPDGFVSELGEGESWAEIFQRAAREGKAGAEQTGDGKTRAWKDKPQDFKRGHVEKVEKTVEGHKLTLEVGDGLVQVFVPDGTETNVDDLSAGEIVPCFDVEVSGEALFTEDGLFKPGTVHVTKLGVKFHVLEVDAKRGQVEIELVEPQGLRGLVRTVKPVQLPEGIVYCQWYTATARPPREGRVIPVEELKKAEAEAGYAVRPEAVKKPPEAGLKLAIKAGGKTGDGTRTWYRRFTVTAGERPVHDVHITLRTEGAKFVGRTTAPRGWDTPKISRDGRSITFDKGSGAPIPAGGRETLAFNTLLEDVEFDWYFTDEEKKPIEGAGGRRVAAVFDRQKGRSLRVDGVAPATAAAGGVVAVTGDGFGTAGDGPRITIGGAEASALQVRDGEILAVVPDAAAGVGLTVSRGGETSDVFPFQVTPTVQTHLTEALAMTRGGTAEIVIEVVGAEEPRTVQLVAVDPAVATFEGAVVVEREVAPGDSETVPLYGLAEGDTLPFVRLLDSDPRPAVEWGPGEVSERGPVAPDQPVIADLVPSRCGVGEPIVIEGANFGDDPEAIRVELGDLPLPVIDVTPERIVARVVETARSGSLTVNRGGVPAYGEAALEIEPSIRLTASRETVRRGQRTVVTAEILGTEARQRVDLYCTTPAIATFEDGAIARTVTTSGGVPNRASLPLDTYQVGQFAVQGSVIGDATPGRWLEVEPSDLSLAASESTRLTVYLVEDVDGALRRQPIRPDRVLLDPRGGIASWRGDLTAGEAGGYLVVIEAAGLQAVLDMVVE